MKPWNEIKQEANNIISSTNFVRGLATMLAKNPSASNDAYLKELTDELDVVVRACYTIFINAHYIATIVRTRKKGESND
ncbi:MAG: hypothetical protein IKO55_05695 [Kiritimatiellae bacterium]|nr:hypothetical protein [Kiritimatiellia bacterium]